MSEKTAKYYQVEPYATILSAIGNGSQNARHKNQLVRLTGMSERALRKSIEHLRRENFVIISDENGYYFPQSQKDRTADVEGDARNAMNNKEPLSFTAAARIFHEFQKP